VIRAVWDSRPVRFARRTAWVHLVTVLGVGMAFAFWLDRQQAQDVAADFRYDATLNDYASCESGNRLRNGTRDLLDGVLAILGTEGRAVFLPVYREALADFQPRNCAPIRARAVEAGVPEDVLDKAAAPPEPPTSLPLATCDGVGPFVEGEDEAYLPELDRDGDGIACE
jgi:hypothetical protein